MSNANIKNTILDLNNTVNAYDDTFAYFVSFVMERFTLRFFPTRMSFANSTAEENAQRNFLWFNRTFHCFVSRF